MRTRRAGLVAQLIFVVSVAVAQAQALEHGGVVRVAAEPAAPACDGPKGCDDSNPCTLDSCESSECKHQALANNTPCLDADVCNGDESCQDGKCVLGKPLNCDDHNVCTTETCDKKAGCLRHDNQDPCSDADPCTSGDRCSAGGCVSGTGPNCEDNNPCTESTCDLVSGGCLQKLVPDGTLCDDHNECTSDDICSGGKCVGTGNRCEDANPCTRNSCDINTRACNFPAETDGTACQIDRCHVGTQCKSGMCQGGLPLDCDDNDACTDDACDVALGCVHTLRTDGAACSDGNTCTTEDVCRAGRCVGSAVRCDALDDCHSAGTCNPSSGLCEKPTKADGTACKAASGSGNCREGICVTSSGGQAGAHSGGAGAGAAGKAGRAGSGGQPELGGSAGNSGAYVRDPGGCNCSVNKIWQAPTSWLFALGACATYLARVRCQRRTRRSLR